MNRKYTRLHTHNNLTGTRTASSSRTNNREVVVAGGTSQRVSITPTFIPCLFENEDRFLHILNYLGRRDFKNLRIVCKAAQDVFDVYQKNSAIGQFWDRSIVSIYSSNLIKSDEVSSHMSEFVAKHDFKRILFLYDEDSLDSFYNFITFNNKESDEFQKKIQVIECIQVVNLTSTEKAIFKKIMKTINDHQKAFINLKRLEVDEFFTLFDGSIPSSVEVFKSEGRNFDVNICNHENLKSITLICVPGDNTFILKQLPKLESLTIESLFGSITINLNECPSLVSINIADRPFHFDRSVSNTIVVRGYEPTRHGPARPRGQRIQQLVARAPEFL